MRVASSSAGARESASRMRLKSDSHLGLRKSIRVLTVSIDPVGVYTISASGTEVWGCVSLEEEEEEDDDESMDVVAASIELDSLEDSEETNESLEETWCVLKRLERRWDAPVSDCSGSTTSAPVFVFCSTSRKKSFRQFNPSLCEVFHN